MILTENEIIESWIEEMLFDCIIIPTFTTYSSKEPLYWLKNILYFSYKESFLSITKPILLDELAGYVNDILKNESNHNQSAIESVGILTVMFGRKNELNGLSQWLKNYYRKTLDWDIFC
jgi:hypothetical protein